MLQRSKNNGDNTGVTIRRCLSLLLITLALVATSVGLSVAPASASQGGLLASGERLTEGQSITSPSRYFTLAMQPDGNLVLYLDEAVYGGNMPVWNSRTYGNPHAYAFMQPQGNLVVYSQTGKALWWSDFGGHNSAYTLLQDDGNLVIYLRPGTPVWQSGTVGTTETTNQGACVSKPGLIPAIHTCLWSTVWYDGYHALSPWAIPAAGIRTSSDRHASCWTDYPTEGWSCGATQSGSYRTSDGKSEDWLNQDMVHSFNMWPLNYITTTHTLVTIHVDVLPSGAVTYQEWGG